MYLADIGFKKKIEYSLSITLKLAFVKCRQEQKLYHVAHVL